MPIEKFVAVFVPAFIAVYAGFTAQEWALSYFKTLDALYALIALQEIFFPKSAGKFWSKVKAKDDEKAASMFLLRTLGFFSLEYRIQALLPCILVSRSQKRWHTEHSLVLPTS